MSTSSVYEKIRADLEAGQLKEIERKILEALMRAPAGLNRKGLIRIVFGEEAQKNLGNDIRDRKIRKAIESLRDQHYPIASTSGKAGYKLTTDPELIESMIRELESRIDHLRQKVDAARSYYDLASGSDHER